MVFAIVDVIRVLTNSDNPQVYWRVLKRLLDEGGDETVTKCNGLKMVARDGWREKVAVLPDTLEWSLKKLGRSIVTKKNLLTDAKKKLK